jgi:hypothetical protein
MYGDLGLISNGTLSSLEMEKGFRDDKLKQLVTRGTNDHKLDFPIEIKGRQPLTFTTQK